MSPHLLKRAYSLKGIYVFLFYNIVILVLWYSCLYVHQDDYSQFELGALDKRIGEITHRKVLVDFSSLERSSSPIKRVMKDIANTGNIVLIESQVWECKECPLRLIFEVDRGQLREMTIEVHNEMKIVVRVKDEMGLNMEASE